MPIGKLLSVPEKREKGVLDDDGIDDAEEKAANARPRRAVPERRPREPNDPEIERPEPDRRLRGARRRGFQPRNRRDRGSRDGRVDEAETRVRLELRALHTAAKSAKDHVADVQTRRRVRRG